MTPVAAPWRVLVADDEPLARRVLRDLLATAARFRLAGECRTGLEVVDRVVVDRPDLLLLDVQMPDLGGLEALRRVPPEARPAVVLVTAYESFALPAFELEALDYLVKPFTDERFAAALARADRRLGERNGRPRPWRSAFRVATGHRVESVPAAEVRWIEARDYTVRLHTADRRFVIRGSLTRLATQLDPARWVRAHRGALVNLAFVERFDRRPGAGHLVLVGGARVAVSERRRAEVLGYLDGPPGD